MPAGSSLSDYDLRFRAGECIDDGRLPVAVSTRLAAGYGTGKPCILCQELVTSEHMEYEVDSPRDGKTLTFHLRCHLAWQLECIRRLPARPPVRVTEPSASQSADTRKSAS